MRLLNHSHPIRKGRPTTLALEEFKKFLFRYVSSTSDPAATASLFAETYADFVAVLGSHLPPVAPSPSPPLTVPLIDFLPRAGAVITEAIGVFWRPEILGEAWSIAIFPFTRGFRA